MLAAAAAAVLSASALIAAAAPGAIAAPVAGAAAASAICGSSSHPALAAQISRGILAARRGRVSAVAVEVDDPGVGIVCQLDSSLHFFSASVVKATILGTLLLVAQEEHRHLTATEQSLAWVMITESDNDAASALWAEDGHSNLQHFLDLAGMTHTILDPGEAWGLTQITAADETRLLWLLLDQNRVLNTSSRDYELNLMAHVIPSQRWGVPAGAPLSLTVHVKNGWLPLASGAWHVHSIGAFTGRNVGYTIVVLTDDNPTMTYGIDTIEAVATVVNHDLNPHAAARVPSSPVSPTWETPDETLP